MPVDLDKLNKNKERIVSTIRFKGPSLPVQIARAVNLEPLFASAFLSELYSEKKLRITNMKVGSSPLYYIQGQEPQLEKFTQYLNQKEKEAFELLKNSKILDDELQSPVIRVALRAIKDFASPVKARVNGVEKLFWRYYLVPDTDLSTLINQITIQQPIENQYLQQQYAQQPIQQSVQQQVQETPQQQIAQQIQQIPQIPQQQTDQVSQPLEKKKKKRTSPNKESFLNEIKEFLKNKNIELISVLEYNNKEITAKIKENGRESLLLALNKKRPDEKMIKKAYKKSLPHNLPYTILTRAESAKSLKEKQAMYSSLLNLHFFE